MIEFTFESIFHTSSKGLPDTSNLEPYSYITMNHFIIIGLVITAYTAMAVYRAFYKINNDKFVEDQEVGDGDQQEEDDSASQKQKNMHNSQQPNTADNLIYRFDQQQESNHEDTKEKHQDQEEQEDIQQNQAEQQQQTVSEQTTEWFLDLDHKMLFFQPFLISFVVVANVFASNIVVVILLGVAVVLFYLFNVRLYCRETKILQVAFAMPCLAAFLMVFVEDLDMGT